MNILSEEVRGKKQRAKHLFNSLENIITESPDNEPKFYACIDLIALNVQLIDTINENNDHDSDLLFDPLLTLRSVITSESEKEGTTPKHIEEVVLPGLLVLLRRSLIFESKKYAIEYTQTYVQLGLASNQEIKTISKGLAVVQKAANGINDKNVIGIAITDLLESPYDEGKLYESEISVLRANWDQDTKNGLQNIRDEYTRICDEVPDINDDTDFDNIILLEDILNEYFCAESKAQELFNQIATDESSWEGQAGKMIINSSILQDFRC
jgi:hypothetical protein